MAHVKGAGTTALGRDSQGQRLGIKIFGNQKAKIGSIIVRQRGLKYRPGKNVKKGSDYTLYSLINGTVNFKLKTIKSFNGKLKKKTIVSVA